MSRDHPHYIGGIIIISMSCKPASASYLTSKYLPQLTATHACVSPETGNNYSSEFVKRK